MKNIITRKDEFLIRGYLSDAAQKSSNPNKKTKK